MDAMLDEVRHPSWRTLGAVAYLWADIAMLWVCFQAFWSAPVGALTLAFLIGYLGNVLPVPGGIGVLDGGLTGAMILNGASPATAAAAGAALVYHAVLLCVPMLLGRSRSSACAGRSTSRSSFGRSAPPPERRRAPGHDSRSR